ncbi:hypothetical protein F5J12DRAFT_906387 [Pisolithus orientalis]|uniref:uncharacterized protein n=1 Tax=Pisolithus orientalis TaxID=936130 RepID=UPI0022246EEF|nr:uncharacterized protein F5J12DRAFT_906387 [Pisolithus orientalis]KAI6002279.1 hypothetical protein F5J12DRAFT_906387 [Pisolithus orientalis]
MPAPQIVAHSPDGIKAFGHVDTLIANATIEDLRAITRNLLASGSPGLASAFTDAARIRLRQTKLDGIHAAPSSSLDNTLARIRSLYGAGMATIGLRWGRDGSMAAMLAVIDTDISQAIQSCKEELEGGRVNDLTAARDAVNKLWVSVQESLADVKSWGGEFPFERAASSIEFWKF